MKKQEVCIRYLINDDRQKYEALLSSGGSHATYMQRMFRWYSLTLNVAPTSDVLPRDMTHEQKRLQEFKLWKYVKCLTKALTWEDFERKFHKFRTIIGEEKIIIQE